MKYYAIRKGTKTGIFLSWEEAKTYVIGFPKAEYKSFNTLELAQAYLNPTKEIRKETAKEIRKETAKEIRKETAKEISKEIISDNGQNLQKHINERNKIYTDGSCINNIGGYGYVYVGGKEQNNQDQSFYGKVPGYCTNQVAELYAIYEALKNFQPCVKDTKIDLYTDSKYSIGCLTEWYSNWQNNGWRNSKGEDVANKELISNILNLLKDKDVKFFHVYGHKGDFYNEQCDKLANMGRLLK
jgi:ribonuclease HI